MDKVLDIFYNKFLKEVQKGKVESDFRYNILFNALIGERKIEAKKYINTIIPTLKISDKKTFDLLLSRYIFEAMSFYDLGYLEVESQIKTLLSFLFANATYDDFENPIQFLQKRIAFLEDQLLPSIAEKFKSELLNLDIIVKCEKSDIVNETPYRIKITLTSLNESMDLPYIYVGIINNEAYIYAIQNEGLSDAKKIKRNLYKLDTNFDVKNDNFENYDIGNLKDISHSFLLAVNILTGILKEKGITKIVVPSILPIRWNSKEISFDIKSEYYDYDSEKRESLLSNHELIQSNLTEKLTRTLLRLAYHHSGINITSYPSENDMNLYLKIEEKDECNNPILDETFKINGGRHV